MSALFSKKNREVLLTPLGLNNPVTVQVLGICSALAVTAQLEPAIVMGLSVTIITAFSNFVISLLRNTIPNRIRIIVQLVVVAALVTIVSEILKAFAYDVSVQLSVYVGLSHYNNRSDTLIRHFRTFSNSRKQVSQGSNQKSGIKTAIPRSASMGT